MNAINTNTQICLDRGGRLVGMDELRAMHDPAHGGIMPVSMGNRHHPVPFYQLVDLVMSKVERLYTGPNGDYVVDKCHLALNSKGTQLFGLLIIRDKPPTEPTRFAFEDESTWRNRLAEDQSKLDAWDSQSTGWMIGFRGSIDQSLSEAMVIGLQVFICENLCISGGADAVWVMRKNTRNALSSMGDDVVTGLLRADTLVGDIQSDIDIFRDIRIPRTRMAELTGLAQYNSVLTSTQANEVYRQIKAPTHDVFKGETLWDYYNHCTEGIKHGDFGHTFEKHGRVHEYCKELISERPLLVAV